MGEPLPEPVRPMLAVAGPPPVGEGWAFEFKWDGVRAVVAVSGDAVRFTSRNGNDVTAGYPELVASLRSDRPLLLDGEIVAADAAGRPDFGLLQQRMHVRAPSERLIADVPVSLYLFDLLAEGERSLLHEPYDARRARLAELGLEDTPLVSVPPASTDLTGTQLLEIARGHGLEGIVAKRRNAPYEPGRRSPVWTKTALLTTQEVVLGGWSPGEGRRTSTLGSLLIGARDDEGLLRFLGHVGTGFTEEMLHALLERLEPLRRKDSPFDETVPREHARRARWVEPRLVGEVEYRTLTHDGRLRHAVWRGLRPDRDPEEIRIAFPPGAAPPPVTRTRAGAAAEARARTPPSAEPERSGRADRAATDDELAALDALDGKGSWRIAGRDVALTNLDKVLFPGRDGEPPVTKRELIRYQAVVAPYALPYLADRPVNLHRFPDGVDRPGFWQKEVPDHAPEWLRRWRNPDARPGESQVYAVVDSTAALVWTANHGAVELHPWTSALPDVRQPTWALIDIDPGPRNRFDDVLVLARLFRTALEHLDVDAAPKVTGQRGIQIWVPVEPGYTFADTRGWVEKLSRAVGRIVPELVSWEWYTDRRQGLARLDYTQNAINKTLVAPFSPRPRPGAPVSMPITWAELDDPDLRPDRWTLRTAPARLRDAGDPLAPLRGRPQRLPPL
ncbi:MAG: ligase [Pseudonocardia sp.]|jgi:bifunctional non-homologous end joining protein LigD|uniref:DNA ligase D n=1 Tax=Pseudonocardia sp. TaxID=60912 RepID=UPI00260479C3|nr:DNA ligase D [Pseudonocardia sp.]MCU1628444.1 ligase [Pseudonocardia sp.]MDT7700374.1 bifunctional non-ous end joining protein LigD [Pseudonocardiales bacterium]